ncbi:MAG: prepilin-type N-terminal cleavage/methylation domain-containing protein [Bacteroidales bacterium]|jgi:type IV pilus assembly protein PilE|nr:prepilin-type N-terminal cleavage/methylation domain-containing protein [Bacteroidales bacterium]
MFKQIKNNKGFTLVEVIVVAVIVLILAAVAIPLYNNYIRDSRKSTASNAAASIATFMGVATQVGSSITTDVTARSWKTAEVEGAEGFGGETSIVCPAGHSCSVASGEVTVSHCRDTQNATTTVRFGARNPLGTITAFECAGAD